MVMCFGNNRTQSGHIQVLVPLKSPIQFVIIYICNIKYYSKASIHLKILLFDINYNNSPFFSLSSPEPTA